VAPVKSAARSILWSVVWAFIATTAVAALFPMDMVVTGSGRVVSLRPTSVVQPLETAIVRAINVREGQKVHAGDVLHASTRPSPGPMSGAAGEGEKLSGRGRLPTAEARDAVPADQR
jgi:hypothetical protein